MSSPLSVHQTNLITLSTSANALKFGSFILKSGRVSPYFFNAGLLSDGALLLALGRAYAHTIVSNSLFDEAEVIFGPAYKGIPFAAVTALILSSEYGRQVGLAYDRKEVKDHGEGGLLVGVPIQGKKVLVLDDVMTAGTAIRQAMKTITGAGGQVIGIVQCLDREEVGKDGVSSTVQEVEAEIGVDRVKSILRAQDLLRWLEEQGGREEDLARMREYREKYGVKV